MGQKNKETVSSSSNAMDDNLLDDQVLFDLTNKLRLDANDEYAQCRRSQLTTVSGSISDEDVSMKDYTEDEIENVEAPGYYSNAPMECTDNTIKQRRRDPTNRKQKTDDEEAVEDSPEGKPISLIRSIFEPETQGYMLGVSHSNHKNSCEKVSSEQVADANSPSLDTVYGKFNDRNVIIHNHFYNIVAAPGFEQEYGHSAGNGHLEDRNRNLQLFEHFKRTLNYSIILAICYLAVRQISRDIAFEYHRLSIRENIQKDQCVEEYYINRCDEYGQLPALKNECLEWKICMNEGNTNHIRSVFYSELAMQVVGRLINESLNNIGGMNRVFLLVALSLWYLVNFACGYMRGTHGEQERATLAMNRRHEEHEDLQLVRRQNSGQI